MSVVFVLTPVAIALALLGLAAFVWAARRGQYDDTWTPGVRMLHDEDPPGPRDETADGPRSGSGEEGSRPR